MKILLLGEYSNLHYTLACALREKGHTVRLVSDGDEWKRYPADVKLVRRSTRLFDTLVYLVRLIGEMRHWRGYDVVQLINPVHFIQLKAERGASTTGYDGTTAASFWVPSATTTISSTTVSSDAPSATATSTPPHMKFVTTGISTTSTAG